MQDKTVVTIASERCHYYAQDGSPRYSIIGKNGSERAVTIKDARENSWVPSVTTILSIADKPGLNIWKAKQILEASLTLPQLPGETLDDYALRVIEDSKAQSKAAADKGTQLHTAIEQWIQGKPFDQQWKEHIENLDKALKQHGIDLRQARAEHSFASPLGYGGKIDAAITL